MLTIKQLKAELTHVNITNNNLQNLLDVQFVSLLDFVKTGMAKTDKGSIYFLPQDVKVVKKLQTQYIKLLNTPTIVQPLNIVNGKVDIQNGQLCYSVNAVSVQDLQTYAKIGAVATEWFGAIEPQQLCRFCVLLSRVMLQDIKQTAAYNKQCRINTDLKTSATAEGKIVFYFDNNNPLMQQLVDTDFFNYAHIKQTSPNSIKASYKSDLINVMEQVVYPLSSAGWEMHSNSATMYYNWLAIPAGVPPQLINGISIHSKNKKLIKAIDTITKMFPTATIFDENGKALHN